jgi:hypothetical protein
MAELPPLHEPPDEDCSWIEKLLGLSPSPPSPCPPAVDLPPLTEAEWSRLNQLEDTLDTSQSETESNPDQEEDDDDDDDDDEEMNSETPKEGRPHVPEIDKEEWEVTEAESAEYALLHNRRTGWEFRLPRGPHGRNLAKACDLLSVRRLRLAAHQCECQRGCLGLPRYIPDPIDLISCHRDAIVLQRERYLLNPTERQRTVFLVNELLGAGSKYIIAGSG